jgi:serine/threonine protein kinase/CheY-like chemotaxis protein
LNQLGFDTLCVGDATQLEQALSNQSVDVVLLDVMLPDRNGREVLTRLRARFSPERLPVIMTTALGKSADVVDFLRLGANDYVVKPLDPAVVAARVSSHLHILQLARARAEGAADGPSSSSGPRLRICSHCGACHQDDVRSCPDDMRPLEEAVLPLPLRIAERYRLVRRAGQGAMGCVFQAFDERLQRSVAIKVLRPEHSLDGKVRERFEREATLSSRLGDPGIAKVHDYGETDTGCLFIVMEWLTGMDLAAILKNQGPGSPFQVVRMLVQATRALDCAHRAGLVHRDIKPANIFIERNRLEPNGQEWQTRLLDFGVAKEFRRDSALTVPGGLIGTPMYMAPEQLLYGSADPRSDIYSLAVAGYEALTGSLPRSLDRPPRVNGTTSTQSSEVVSLRRHRPGLSAEFDAAFLSALAWDPEHRPSDATKWSAELTRTLESCLSLGHRWSFDAGSDSEASKSASARAPEPVISGPRRTRHGRRRRLR